MYGVHSPNGYVAILPGIQIKTLVHGQDTLMTEFILSKDAVLPEHAHMQEQTGYLVSGRIKLYIDAESRTINPGDSWCIPSNIKHRAEILENSIALEIFSPCREEYIQYAHPDDIG